MKLAAKSPAELLAPGRPLTLANVAEGAEGLVLSDLARAIAARPDAPPISLVVICRDGQRMALLARALAFFAPDIATLEFPAWDCQPYDRVSPHAGFVAQRMTTLARLARLKGREGASILLTTVNAVLQRVPQKSLLATQSLAAAPGNMLAMDGIVRWLELNGFLRASTVRRSEERRVGKEWRSLCDWSSDVCSSDLARDAVACRRARQHAGHGRHRALARAQRLPARLDGAQIGRASCRERVEISV